MEYVLDLVSDIWRVTCELAPWLLMGAVLSGGLHLFLPKSTIQKHLNGRTGVLRAVLFGIPLPLCSCGVVPAGIGLKKDGASNGAAIGFLIATPQTGVDSIIASAGILGWPFSLFKVVAALITGIFGGYATDRFASSANVPSSNREDIPKDAPPRLRDGLEHGVEIIRSIWIWLVIGILVSVAIDRSMSGVVRDIGEAGIIVSTIVALACSLPLYVCATASLPIAAQLIDNGLPVGSALVFLMAGPATNIATVGAIRSHFGWKPLAIYLGTIILFSMLFAALFDAFFSASLPHHIGNHHTHNVWWHHASAIILVLMISRFAWLDFHRNFFRINAKNDTSGWRISIDGMTCRNCANGLTDSLTAVPGVSAVDVDLAADEALVNGNCTESALRKAVESAGFKPTRFQTLSPS